jgi:hypothetical protein
MADAPVVHIGENSLEYVAYRLMRDIAHVEKKKLNGIARQNPPDRKWILDTYAECRQAVIGQRDWLPAAHGFSR